MTPTTSAGDNVPDGAIIITPREFYDGVKADIRDIGKAVSDLDKKLDPLPVALHEMESRLALIEQRVWMFTGIAAGAGAVFGTLASYVRF